MTYLTPQEARERIEGVLNAAGVKLSLMMSNSDFWMEIDAEFPDGAVYSGIGSFVIECDGLSHQRG